MSNPHPTFRPKSRLPVLGDPHQLYVLRRARRAAGVSAIEIAEVFQVTRVGAWRYLRRLVRKGLLYRTQERRHRIEMFGCRRWTGVVIYRTTGAGRDASLRPAERRGYVQEACHASKRFNRCQKSRR